ncbi:MAG TPA: valine--tRNA ligase [Candidatus Wildermuthbacteria bacterium]|uniref:Valine--tRNA ligase n=1 Tax=Candidatus Yanofskybacteria bacterium GW2011_GWC1_48_11 TaxID=1619027 RepID=A0A837IM95_9BACT|nr:MAG: Valyl-tRNA synthetase [Candidatus Yanofskybacteria bacterium GW2011_GWC1_48_11]KKW03849.1 MAG: Valyl-tRNA synthetase [Parcubacteria group bacterium GW2011_GWB1_49_12]KKW08589.1 MAG: Valyl-tRNA synthetase [Parcubacteria group bacterium GW2011_GWA1_49_26]OHA61306.1 MAG: valine--tRNA ligase [Candidatus Wildermuthbacteria bacterium GWA1_49_26]OHA65465.1 MAG: valine--tRNA ligase [Candidatus Wildermuthbacteria bacterium RIFCSPHIGHO2_01_FULL_50_47]OHA70029.1 MAG: valine--tRNA ligase [Candidat
MRELPKAYNPQGAEENLYKLWEESGFFAPEAHPPWAGSPETNPNYGKTFTIIMPPTNANGDLHAGHGLVMTLEDIMIRFNRMRGKKTLWLPGNDHAGFETQVVYEKVLEKQGRSRFDIAPEDLYKEIWGFTQNNRSNINSQVKKIGASCDWSREKFTLDRDIVKTVYSTFEKLFHEGLIYRGKKIVSWCPKHQTSFSDLEIVDEERTDKFYYVKYGPFTIGTARPETKFGDKYVVMHPADKRYQQYKDGQKIELEWINGPITATVVKDEAVDMEFGTGAMTITPWHDAADFDIAERHHLDREQIIDEQGRLLPIAGGFAGMKITEARPKIVEKLASKGLVEKIDDNYKHAVKLCYKCNSLIEPQVKSQWFIKMRPLAEPIIKAIEKKEITYVPDHYEKITLHWLNNIIDWNISRQIIWGIPIPAKICDTCEGGLPDLENKVSTCPKCKEELREETDTFDTWFSSGQWPFAALGYPDSKDFKEFYPTQVMETAGEIIFFWVSRMLMLGKYVTGKLPFNTVYLHGLVLDAKGKKMSKSKGNVINPLDLTAKYGTDAFRMGLIVGNTPGTSLALSEDKIKAHKHFANKLWNIARFVLSHVDEAALRQKPELLPKHKKILEEFAEIARNVTADIEEFRFYLAAEKLYHYAWHTFADKVIEESKEQFRGGNGQAQCSAQWTLFVILRDLLKLLHPFTPFVTEAIYQNLPDETADWAKQQTLMIEQWPA